MFSVLSLFFKEQWAFNQYQHCYLSSTELPNVGWSQFCIEQSMLRYPILHQAFITKFLVFAQVVLHWAVFKDGVFISGCFRRVHFTLVCSALCCVCPCGAVAPFLVVTRVFYMSTCSLCYRRSLYRLLLLLSLNRASSLSPEKLKFALHPHPREFNILFFFSMNLGREKGLSSFKRHI